MSVVASTGRPISVVASSGRPVSMMASSDRANLKITTQGLA